MVHINFLPIGSISLNASDSNLMLILSQELNQASPVYGNLKVELIMLHYVAPQLIHLYEIDWDPSLVLVWLVIWQND